jgi:dipeptidyl-peptidase-3
MIGASFLAWPHPVQGQGPGAGAAPVSDPLVGELGRIGPPGKQILMLGLDAPGFEELTPKERAFIYYMNRAAIAGDGVFTHQNHRHAPELLAWLDAVDQANEVLAPGTAAAVREELLRLIIHHGQYDQREHVKHERWALTPTVLAEATLAAEKAGANLPKPAGETTEQMMQRLLPHLLDAETEPVHVEQSKGKDIITGSAVNLYAPGMNLTLMETLLDYWRTKINVRFDLRDGGRVMMHTYKIGGLYSQELWVITHWLKKAMPLAASKAQADSIHALIDYYTTGDEGLFREHAVHWLKTDARTDYLNGFIETYHDPRGVVGSYEANVSFQSESALLKKLTENAPYFEEKMPWDKKWKRPKVDIPVASVVNVVMATGDAGPVSAAAYNLPNYDDVRRDHGSKNVVLLNVELSRSEEVRRAVIEEFYPMEDRENALKYGDLSRRWIVYMHEVIGHGSGMPDPAFKGRSISGRTLSALEETRADLVGLYQVMDPKLLEMGAFPDSATQEKVARDMLVSYTAGDLVAMRADVGTTLREAHRRGHHLVTEFLLDGGGRKQDYGLKRMTRDGETFVVVMDLKKARRGLAELLSLLQRFKSTADDAGATELFAKYGTELDPKLKAEVESRAAPLNLPTLRAFAYPRLVPVIQDGEVVDARRIHDEDILTQHRRFKRIARETSLEAPAP